MALSELTVSSTCEACGGKVGVVYEKKKCPTCGGKGETSSVGLDSKLGDKELSTLLKEGKIKCPKCRGKGEIEHSNKCPDCGGHGKVFTCKVCSKKLKGPSDMCPSCNEVYKLSNVCTLSDVREGQIYQGMVTEFTNFGVFINLNIKIKGLLHSKNLGTEKLKENEEVTVRVNRITSNGNLDLILEKIGSYSLIDVEKELPVSNIQDLKNHIGKLICIHGEILQIKQTSGPTIFTMADESGIIQGAAFEKAGMRAYPDVENGNIAQIMGDVNMRNQELQVEIKDIKLLWGEKASQVAQAIEKALDERAEPPVHPFLIESETLERLKDRLKNVAKVVRKNIFKSTPIIIRHHSDADGITAGVAMEQAILSLIKEVSGQDGGYHNFRRTPSRAPFYEMVDITRDLVFALEDKEKFGQVMPLIMLLDNGSTYEDLSAIKMARIYGIEVIVIDHHFPDGTVDEYLTEHINPYLVDGDYGLTTGMMCTELARMINPEISDKIQHFPAVSAVGDRSAADERDLYIQLVSDRYKLEDLKDIAQALDYQSFWLKFQDGRGLINDILNLGRLDRHKQLVTHLTEQAEKANKEQIKAVLPHVKSTVLPNGTLLSVFDLEKFALKFTFPPPGRTSGEIHDRICIKNPDRKVVTLGYGPDFAVIRSRNINLNIPRIVRELMDEVEGGGVSGGGHLVVGSIKFVEGMRTEVLQKFTEKVSRID